VNQAIALVAAYLLGSIPFALIAGRLNGVDLRTVGSGNLGATNVFRTLGRTWGIAVMILDIAKGAAAVLLAEALTSNPWPLAAGALAILGHVFPVWTGFKGGKGVAVGAGALIGLVPAASGIILVVWVLLVVTTRYVSVASLGSAITLPTASLLLFLWGSPDAWFFGRCDPLLVLISALMSGLAIWRHKDNIKRLFAGTEKRFERKARE
jgi:glycerol-3-phosphate acyltransferase PlsY